MVRSEGNMSLKNPVTPPGIDPGNVRLVAQRLNHYATPGSLKENMHENYVIGEKLQQFRTNVNNNMAEARTC